MPTEYRKKDHSVFQCDYHIVIPTKYRRKIIDETIKAFIGGRIGEIEEHYPELIFKQVNTDKDHVHMLVSIPPSWSVGKVVGIVKANTAKAMKANFAYLKQVYWGTDSIWSEGYFVSTVGIDQKTIEAYITNQGKADSGQNNLRLF
jgi:putative transposase